jgi:energy-coupling factor transporter ATP-binding protein EcfA2
MRIESIELSWFRGAADPVALTLECKSKVVYGGNGSGKSSFVDAVEYVLNEGKIKHLAHEYSGKHQEKAIPNTHRPDGRKTRIKIRFQDKSDVTAELDASGIAKSSDNRKRAMADWSYQCTTLRQDEVSQFIRDTKGEKYSALLPLLGLEHLEMAAENLRQLSKVVEEKAELKQSRVKLKEVAAKRMQAFDAADDTEILCRIEQLHGAYCPEQASTVDPLSRCRELETAIETRITLFSDDQRRHLTLLSVGSLNLRSKVSEVRATSLKLAGEIDPLVSEKLEILGATKEYVGKLGDTGVVDCPSCGRPISVSDFKFHVNEERDRLQDIINANDARKESLATLSDSVKSLKSGLEKSDVKSWREELAKGSNAKNFAFLHRIDAEAIRSSCREKDLTAIEDYLLPLTGIAAEATKDALPDVRQLNDDKSIVLAGKAVIEAHVLATAVNRAESLISFINSLEENIRGEIRARSGRVIEDISGEIESMWGILHPGEEIEKVRLYVPSDTDKAIDIGLKFFGVDQDSPRLTLSEGHRNSLGLCIFLAMAKKDEGADRPLFLDDVVISLDRNHRGMIAELLENRFANRQIVLLTHDREWYSELRTRLDNSIWSFHVLLPWDSPETGIRWSGRTTTFDDAQEQLKRKRPDSAGNDARKIMDFELTLVAEHLELRLPFLRGDKNDRRGAHEFLERLIADGKTRLQRKEGGNYVPFDQAILMLDQADRLLMAWGNRGSHTFDVAPSEAAKLIDTCEKALQCLQCPDCQKNIWFAEASGGSSMQCKCGALRWQNK